MSFRIGLFALLPLLVSCSEGSKENEDRLDALENSLADLDARVSSTTAFGTAITANASDIAINTGNIATNTADIAANAAAIAASSTFVVVDNSGTELGRFVSYGPVVGPSVKYADASGILWTVTLDGSYAYDSNIVYESADCTGTPYFWGRFTNSTATDGTNVFHSGPPYLARTLGSYWDWYVGSCGTWDLTATVGTPVLIGAEPTAPTPPYTLQPSSP